MRLTYIFFNRSYNACLMFQLLGLDKGLAPESFGAIDTNNDGLLSKEEFT